jgi:hypothetical protein
MNNPDVLDLSKGVVGGSLKQPCYEAAWPDRCEEMRRYGLMHGMLQGLRYCVDQETRAKIDLVLIEIEKPHNRK